MRPRLLLVDDDAGRAEVIARVLGLHFECTVAHTVDCALHALAGGGWAAAVVDFDLGQGGTGFLVLQAVYLISPRTALVLYSSHWCVGLAQEARRIAHAHASLDARREDFLLELRRTVKALSQTGPAAEGAGEAAGAAAEGAGEAAGAPADRWCACAPATQGFLEELRQAAGDDGPVFVHGEPGVGKHLAAETLQRWRQERGAVRSPRGNGARAARIVRVPPLRERRGDLPRLAEMFLADLAERTGSTAHHAVPAALAELARRDWWGNVRELRATLYRAARRAGTRSAIEAPDLPTDIVPAVPGLQMAKEEGLRNAVLLQLRTASSVSAAARLARVTRPNFKRLMNRHGVLRADTFRDVD